VSTIPSLVHRNATLYGDLPALSFRGDTLTWSQARLRIAQIARALSALGVGPGDRVALMMSNRPEHWMADQAAVHLGAIPSTVYATMPSSQVSYIARHSRAKVAILEGADQVARWRPILGELPHLEHVIVLEGTHEGFLSWDDLVTDEVDLDAFEQGWQDADPSDPVALIYTSGTTGVPKGVLLTHQNVIANVDGQDAVSPIPQHFSNVCFLPLAHIAERMVSVYMPIHKAGHVTFCPDQAGLLGELVKLHPTLFFGVPRVWEKLAAGLRMHEGSTLATVGLDQVQWACSAGAPLPVDVQRYFRELGLTILESWGMTEATGVATTTGPKEFRFGSVGHAIAGNETMLLEDGEVLIRGPIICAGYLQEDGSVLPATDAEGWLHTGDIGRIDEDGHLFIIDRKKELIITSGGKNIAPVAVEALLKRHPLVGQALAYGDAKPYLVALLVLDAEAAPAWATARGITFDSLTDLSQNPLVVAELDRAVEAANAELARVEQIKRFHVLTSEWTVEGGELTPSLKMKRCVVQTKHETEIESLYS